MRMSGFGGAMSTTWWTRFQRKRSHFVYPVLPRRFVMDFVEWGRLDEKRPLETFAEVPSKNKKMM